MKRLNFFDEISRNKRNSILLAILGAVIYFIFIYLLSYVAGLPDLCGFSLGLIFLLYSFWNYFGGLESSFLKNAKKVTRKSHPFIWNTVEGLSLATNIPMPEIYIVDESAPNAFAVGRSPENAKIVLTSGILKLLNNEELEGVIAHEISHIANYDVRINLVMVAFLGSLSMFIYSIIRLFSGSRKNKGNFVLLLILAAISTFIMSLIRFAVSREREYLADAYAVKLIRYPKGLANALRKISKKSMKTSIADDSTSHLFFFNPFPGSLANLFSTHPPVEKRIKRLMNI